MVQVAVHNNALEVALRLFKKKLQLENLFSEMKRRRYYEPPSKRRVRKDTESKRRRRKMQRKREGDI